MNQQIVEKIERKNEWKKKRINSKDHDNTDFWHEENQEVEIITKYLKYLVV